MIRPDKIQNVMKALSEAIGIALVRAEQNGKRPKDIFLSYKIISQEGEPAWQKSKFRESGETEGTVTETEKGLSSPVVSCTIIGPGSNYNSVWDRALEALAWIESEDAELVCKENSVIPIYGRSSIQDRTAFLETGYECRLGFDISFSAAEITIKDTPAVDIAATAKTITMEE